MATSCSSGILYEGSAYPEIFVPYMDPSETCIITGRTSTPVNLPTVLHRRWNPALTARRTPFTSSRYSLMRTPFRSGGPVPPACSSAPAETSHGVTRGCQVWSRETLATWCCAASRCSATMITLLSIGSSSRMEASRSRSAPPALITVARPSLRGQRAEDRDGKSQRLWPLRRREHRWSRSTTIIFPSAWILISTERPTVS